MQTVVAPDCPMKRLCALAALLCCLGSTAYSADETALSTEGLIDELTILDSSTPGVNDLDVFDGFIGDGTSNFAMGIIPAAKPETPPAMKELVDRGISALPVLLKHIEDPRPTHILVGGKFFADQIFMTEYQFRDRHRNYASFADMAGDLEDVRNKIPGQYTVKVGDVCEVLIGQIVNRGLLAVRYQPTAILIVNSPVARPKLAEWMRQDWDGLTAQEHEASLITDLQRADRDDEADAALARLRFYYPGAYAGLVGADRRKRDAFELRDKQHAGH